MRAVVQRVSQASVRVEGELISQIERGFLVLLGVEEADEQSDVSYISTKIAGLRIFEDEEGKMNRSISDCGGSVLLVSQFTLLGDARKGRRPSFIAAARPEKADVLYREVRDALEAQGITVCCGKFQTHMEVGLVNDGPVTILLDSRKVF